MGDVVEGLRVGVFEGASVVGFCVGLFEGWRDGVPEGGRVSGFCVGLFEGSALGVDEGIFVGRIVGYSVLGLGVI